MTPEDRIVQRIGIVRAEYAGLVEDILALLAEEREACAKAVCLHCEKGAPISDAHECMSMGHFQHGDTCHPYSWDKRGRVTGHIACRAASIRALATSAPSPPSPGPPSP